MSFVVFSLIRFSQDDKIRKTERGRERGRGREEEKERQREAKRGREESDGGGKEGKRDGGNKEREIELTSFTFMHQ